MSEVRPERLLIKTARSKKSNTATRMVKNSKYLPAQSRARTVKKYKSLKAPVLCCPKALQPKPQCPLRPPHKIPKESISNGTPMDWRKAVAHITGAVYEELLLRREYLSAENRILIQQL